MPKVAINSAVKFNRNLSAKMLVGILIVFLVSCVAPKPKTVSGKKRVPVNTTEIVIPQPVKPKQIIIDRRPELEMFTFNFAFESTALSIPNDALYRLLPLALKAEKIHIRGRTDNTKESRFDLKIAKGRAQSARKFLIEKGVNPQAIFINYTSASDYVSENITSEGRARNRRVEILIFHNYTEI